MPCTEPSMEASKKIQKIKACDCAVEGLLRAIPSPHSLGVESRAFQPRGFMARHS